MPSEVMCMAKGPDNHGEPKWRVDCKKCCAFCEEKSTCPNRVCVEYKSPEEMCCWIASPAEYMMGKIDSDSAKETYHLRRVEHWIKEGYKAGDGSWEGGHLVDFKRNRPDDYRRLTMEDLEDEAGS